MEFERDAMSIFATCGGKFPMVEKALEISKRTGERGLDRGSGSEMVSADDEIQRSAAGSGLPGVGGKAAMKVIWAEECDANTNEVICRLIAEDGGILNAFSAVAVSDDGKVVDCKKFVSFNKNMAFAGLKIPKEIFSKCSVMMETAVVARDVKRFGNKERLERFDAAKVKPIYSVVDPTPKDDKRNCIKISYDTRFGTANYDYVYPGRQEDQFYMPSCGTIRIPNTTLEEVDMTLSVSAGKNVEVEYPEEAKLEVKGNEIKYAFQEKWDGVKMWDVFALTGHGGHNDIEYILDIAALKSDKHTVTMLITNIEKIRELLNRKESDSVYPLKRIDAYVDCLAAGTMIRMADGSDRAVEKLRPGERILSKDGMTVPVREVITAENCSVLEVTLEDGSRLRLTDGHAVYTAEGAYPASRLKQGQMLLTVSGRSGIQSIERHCAEDVTVCTVFLEDDSKGMFANGIMVHNSESRELFQDRDWVREDLPEEWLEDYDSAVRAGIIYDG